jgi:hypothetical protein
MTTDQDPFPKYAETQALFALKADPHGRIAIMKLGASECPERNTARGPGTTMCLCDRASARSPRS